ncbi:PREDICTED: uncharacterized protein LOC108356870 isoform X1 [Rhagoletis zephyria]|uniref:uncharacterized protein LOC108356870 isoform X1 n=2 Tax=Rhagoletis zephyria TaxID=28612 RepID=UPI000811A8D7|nr:PREDICTED: uncharacterized protein LOC108356870 isoform X1 [Rhagoletis zephyria]
MDFPQQLEEILVERPPSSFDVIMESPLCAANSVDRKGIAYKAGNKFETTSVLDKMNTSINSTLEDTTPSDSGVQMLDSESSEFMVESITSQTGFEFEELKSYAQERADSNEQVAVVAGPPSAVEERHFVSAAFEEIVAGVDTNSNVTTIDSTNDNSPNNVPIEEAMTTSTCSTFDATENIVYRRKVRKTPIAPKAPKKRVSFHEDILKNTRTDNIHIEHGFITYKAGRKALQHIGAAGRYSWCSEGDGGAAGKNAAQSELCAHAHEDEGEQKSCEQRRRCVVYRNACSDVLDYGNSDVYDMEEQKALQYDNSGVFEYMPKERSVADENAGVSNIGAEGQQVLYRCSCSSSNSSLDSDENEKNSNRQQYGQAKSSSCDCIGMSNANNNIIGDNCYFSEPNIDNLNENNQKKSVWNKEKKPKSSCLKKPKRNTNIIYEQDLSTRVKKFNVHDMNQLIDNSSKIIIGSLKSIFTMPLPERGVPEGSEDLQSVVECIPELEPQTPEHKSTKPAEDQIISPPSPPLKQKPFLSKSLDGSKKSQGVKKFVHNVDEQLRRKNDEEMYAPTRQSSDEKTVTDTPNRTLQRQEEIDADQRDELVNTNTQTQQNDESTDVTVTDTQQPQASTEPPTQFRNKFIVNCESTVFEHTGVSYCYDTNEMLNLDLDTASHTPGSVASSLLLEDDTPIAQPEPDQLRSAFSAAPIAKTFSNFFRSFNKDSTSTPNAKKTSTAATKGINIAETQQRSGIEMKFSPNTNSLTNANDLKQLSNHQLPNTISSSTISELTNTSSASSLLPAMSKAASASISVGSVGNSSNNSLAIGQELRGNIEKQQRHLPSPLKKHVSGSTLAAQPQRYGTSSGSVGNTAACPPSDPSLHSPDIFNVGSTVGLASSSVGGGGCAAGGYIGVRGGCGRDSKSTILSEEFDDIITITTDTDKNESDIVIVDYPSELSERQSMSDYANLLKPPQPNNAKTSLINRFLRNVTQKKILESSIRKNNFFAGKLKSEQRLFSGNLYVPGVKPKNYELIDDLNAEIAMEIEMSGANSPRRELVQIDDLPGDVSRFELGIGEISIDIFNGNYLHILRDPTEQLMKVFKLYTGYSCEGYMTPVLVFLTDRTLYVADLVRNRLCSKFVLTYAELDVILMGPFGNTVLLSNSTRDMQQVLLAGGPYPADGLVANLEMCARRSGSSLPAVGQLSFAHLAPLQAFVRENSSVGATDSWMYYAVVNVPAGVLGSEQEPLGPHVKGFLMHRRIKEHQSINSANKHIWNPGYFLLKAGVLYMFNDSTQKIPSWAMALAECQGARRAVKAGRPHCFEIILKGQLLQLAAPDEYVASEWLQALLQTASGLFEMQEKHKTLGCSLVVTQNHLITLREDFSAPLNQIKIDTEKAPKTTMAGVGKDFNVGVNDECSLMTGETGSLLSSAMSTPTRFAQRSCSSMNSTPTKLSQLSQSTATGGGNTTHSTSTNATTTTTTNATSIATTTNITNYSRQLQAEYGTKLPNASYSNMYSVYGKNSGLEILTCADIKEMTGIKIPSHNDTWWCVLEFSCQEVRESTDDLVIFFASSSEMQRFLRLLEHLWQAKNNDLFPITVLDEDDLIAEQCTMLYMDINRAWEPLLSAAMGYPL